MFDGRELDLWIENDFNVLFRGKHGVGKTAVIIEAFNRHNLNWKYFSAATMDPWVDFVGVPKDSLDENGQPVLDLIRPRDFHNGQVEAIFMDELNRAPKKVRNAVMELIQFKSINGVKFPNLRFIWAAINPEDDDSSDTTYDVDRLDPAQKDRFQIIVDVPYKPVASYFTGKYGIAGEGAIDWWNGLDEAGRDKVSPRRLEYAIQVWQAGGNVRHVLNDKTLNTHKLITLLESGNKTKTLKGLLNASKEEKSKVFSNVNFANMVYNDVIKNAEYIKAYIEFMPKDKLSDTIISATESAKLVVTTAPDVAEPILKSIIESNSIKGKKLSAITSAYGEHATKFFTSSKSQAMAPTDPASPYSPSGILFSAVKCVVECPSPSISVIKQQQTDNVNKMLRGLSPGVVNGNKIFLRQLMTFIALTAARTQAGTLKYSPHPLTAGLTIIVGHIKLLLGTSDSMQSVWDDVKADMMLLGSKRSILPLKRSVRALSSIEIDKIEDFLHNTGAFK